MLVAVRDYRRMEHLRQVLDKTNLRRHDIVVMSVRTLSTGAGEYELTESQIFSDYEKELFSHVVELAEKEGKHVELLVVPGGGSLRGPGPDRQQPASLAPGDRRQRAHDFRGAGASDGAGLGATAARRAIRFRSK